MNAHFAYMSLKKTTGKPIKWIICFSLVLSKVFFAKRALQIKLWYSIKCVTKTEFCLKFMKFDMKNWFLGSMGSNPLKWLPPKNKDLGLDEPYLTTPLDQKLELWLNSYSIFYKVVFLVVPPRRYL